MNSRNSILIVSLAVFLLTASFVFAETNLPTITIFYSEDCPHCHDELSFLENFKKEIPDLEIIELEVKYNKKNREVFLETLKKYDIKNAVVPITFIGDEYIIGFSGPENTGEKIRQIINDSKTTDEDAVSHPIFGKINIKNLSLPVLTIVLGILDGFNPCAMWSLVALLTLVIATGSRKKVWLIGGVFLLVSAVLYYIFMAAWLNIFILLDFLAAIQIIIGILAMIAGIIFIRNFFTFKPGVCEISSPGQQEKITEKFKKAISSASWPAMILGVIAVAFSVNLFELFCSLGIPAIFTKALTLSNLATWEYYIYLGLYDFFYILDDALIFLVAVFTLKFFHLSGKYIQYSRLIGGILMIILGAIFLLKPELLMFK